MEEIWKDIEGFEGKYQVSNTGKVASLNFNNTGKFGILKQKINRYGYSEVKLSKNNKTKDFLVSTLVGNAFLKNKNKDVQIMHLKDTTDNSINNLKVAYRSEIHHQAYKRGTRTTGKATRYKISYKRKGYMNLSQMAKANGIEPKLLHKRLDNGWTLKDALYIPKLNNHKKLNVKLYEYNGKLMSMNQLSKLSGISVKTLNKRLKRGWDIESMVEIPLAKNNNKKE